MQQTLHIVRKDIRYLSREISLVLALAALFAWKDPWWVDILLLVSAAYLIARVIHAEAIPGDRQFWITRPYRWQSLAGAKLLFILVFVNLPILAGQFLIVLRGGFPLASIWPGLLWSLVLMILCFSLPIAALAAVTSGIVPFIFATLTLLVIGLSITQMVLPQGRLLPVIDRWPAMVEWVRNSGAVFALVLIALVALYSQYKNRRTVFSRAFALGAITLAAVAYLYLPRSLGFAVQMRFSQPLAAISSLSASIDPGSFQCVRLRWTDQIQVRVRAAVRGIPDGFDVRADAFSLAFERPDGAAWKSDLEGDMASSTGAGVTTLDGMVMMPPSFFNAARRQPLTLQASLYLTLFETLPTRTLALTDTPVNASEGLQCYQDAFNNLFCRSAFRWPARLVYARAFQTNLSLFYSLISYSPFPAVLDLNPIESHWASGGPSSSRDLTLLVKKPVATSRRDIEVHGVRLSSTSWP